MQKIVSGLALMTLTLLLWSMQASNSYGAGGHQHKPHSHTMQKEKPAAPIRMTMEELHQMGGVPMGWKFELPKGDPKQGRQVFVKLECTACHAVQGESFPEQPGQVGPDLTEMGIHHPAAYFAETIINPNRVIIVGEGYTGSDGLSTMPSYNEDLTVAELVDLVAYLKSLTPKGGYSHTGR
ncbi:MAG: c-type cytochrome [candidate division NC10 bacterium]